MQVTSVSFDSEVSVVASDNNKQQQTQDQAPIRKCEGYEVPSSISTNKDPARKITLSLKTIDR